MADLPANPDAVTPDLPREPRLLERLVQVIRVRHYSRRTERSYSDWVRRYIRFHGKRHPQELGATHVEAFLSSLAHQRNVAASTQNQALSAILFLYKSVLKVDLAWMDGIARAKRPLRLPVVLTEQEARRLLDEMRASTR